MNSNIATRESRRRTAWAGLWIVGAVALGGLTALGQPLAGVGIYTLAAIVAVGMWVQYSGKLFDERDATIHKQASGYTIGILAIVSAVVFPLLTGLYGLGRFEWGTWTTASAFLVAGMFAIYALATLIISHRK